MSRSVAAAITRAASKQTYYTIRFLVDGARMEDAYRAYAYFRWLDDVLDADGHSGPLVSESERDERRRFLDRQERLLEQCLLGEPPPDVNQQEAMLVELTRHAAVASGGLRAYLRSMMQVMDFDVKRRGRLISEAELHDYTRWLAIAVTEAVDYFIGNGSVAPHDQTRYMAASGAHIMHMLRDTHDDVRLGYYNVPREVLEAHAIGPLDVDSDAYRAWVKSRVQLARTCFDAGRSYLARVENFRHRLAALTYMARFEWLTEALEREDFRIRAAYGERHSVGTGLRMGWLAVTSMLNAPAVPATQGPVAAQSRGEV